MLKLLGEDAAYTLGVQDRAQRRPMRESYTLHVSDQNHYVNGYRDMSTDMGASMRERFTTLEHSAPNSDD